MVRPRTHTRENEGQKSDTQRACQERWSHCETTTHGAVNTDSVPDAKQALVETIITAKNINFRCHTHFGLFMKH